MSQYINLDDDPGVYYYMNFGQSEAYIVTPDAERIDIVRCKDCLYYMNGHICSEMSRFGAIETKPMDFCSYGMRSADDDEK